MSVMPDAKQLAHEITLVVRIKRSNEWALRLKIGSLLMRLAAWVMWMGIELEEVDA